MPASKNRWMPHLLRSWTWRMAWRDSRASRRKLLLFSSSIVLGIAALAAIGSLGRNLEQAVEEQTKTLLGADLVIQSRQPFTPEEDRWLQSIGGEQSREVSFTSMVLFPRTGNTRLVDVHALGAGFPFYGSLDTDPASAAADFRARGGALVQESLLQQFGASIGDEVRVGKLATHVLGDLKKIPGETVALSVVAPRVYISMNDLPATGLLQEGSLARYRVYYKFAPGTDVSKLVERIHPELDKFRLGHDTVEQRKRELGRSMDNLYHFLNLVGFIALLLGGIGVAGSIHVHIKQKLGTVAVLRCLGGSTAQTFAVYLAQGIALGAAGAILGGALGIAVQRVLPGVLADFIPFDYQFQTSWLAVGRAMAIGLCICLLFALLPLLTVRRISPLAAIRASYEPARRGPDPLRWVVLGILAAGIVAFALTQTRNWRVGLGFAAGLAVTFGVLAAIAKALTVLTRKYVPACLPFSVRQGIANLHRPDNRTRLLLLSLGLGTFLMMSLFLVQRTLLNHWVRSTGKDQPNAVLFDIQTPQLAAVTQVLRSMNLPVLDEAPIVTMRLTSVKGRPVDDYLTQTNRGRGGGRWAYRREYRSTYTDRLRDGEKIVDGQWIGNVTNDTELGTSATGAASGATGDKSKEVPISLERGIARDLQVGLGDELVFDVQGVPIATRVASLREVEWRRIQPNFFVVFPRGVLEQAPAMHVLVTHVVSSGQSATMQRAVVQAFPNVSTIDLTLVLQTIDAILGKISFVIRFLAMFTVATGFLVLITALLTGRYQRIQESVLLRTLGASRAQIFKVLLVEYASLGILSAFAGILLAVAAAWALARFVFQTPFAIEPAALVIGFLVIPTITVLTGMLMSRGVMNHPPLAVLRSEL